MLINKQKSYFITFKESDYAVDITEKVLCYLFQYHVIHRSIVSNRDLKIFSGVWEQLKELCFIWSAYSYYSSLNWWIFRVEDRTITNFLMCYCNYHQNDRNGLLPRAEPTYISVVSSDLGIKTFKVDTRRSSVSPNDTITIKMIPRTVFELNEKFK